jgi:dipeptidyl aminopeptidase/acylaminoacyl peptidase
VPVAQPAGPLSALPKVGADQSRAALWGGSYGGYMVLAGLAFQPGLWAAGVDIVGIASLVTFLENTSAYRRAYRDPRVPLNEAEQIHAAMTARDRECELLVYGDERHGLTKRANRAEAMSRAFACRPHGSRAGAAMNSTPSHAWPMTSSSD